jgi:ribosome-associated protein
LSHAAQRRFEGLAERFVNSAQELVIASARCRSQARNREACLEMLRTLIVQARAIPKKRRKTKPSRGAVEKRLQGKRERADAKKRRGRSADGD